MYPAADDGAIELLNRMLRFDPRKRISLEDTLCHPFFADMRNPPLELTVRSPMSFDLENSFESTENLRSSVSTN
jgi:serine/threonine protein kinase